MMPTKSGGSVRDDLQYAAISTIAKQILNTMYVSIVLCDVIEFQNYVLPNKR